MEKYQIIGIKHLNDQDEEIVRTTPFPIAPIPISNDHSPEPSEETNIKEKGCKTPIVQGNKYIPMS